MKALQFSRDLPRYAASRLAGSIIPGRGASWGPLRLRDLDPPKPPGPEWVRLRPRLSGICGSDLATIDGHSARYFEPLVSFPFVPGHEVVADLPDAPRSASIPGAPPARRVVLQPVLSCITRGIDPVCGACADGRFGNCERTTFGDLEPGIQTGTCCDTGGGWSTAFMAHPSQLHPVPADLSDEAAVMVEPTACAVHAVLLAHIPDGATVAVIGSGTLGLLTIAAIRAHAAPGTLIATGKYSAQRALALALGADTVVEPGELRRAVRRATGTLAITNRSASSAGGRGGEIGRLTGGADIVIDCVGSEASIADALAVVRPRGRVVLVGMPERVSVELTSLWHREVELVGAYTYGWEQIGEQRVHTFDLAFDLVRQADLGRLVSAAYPLDRYTEALEHAANAGPRGAVKVAFDLRGERERDRL